MKLNNLEDCIKDAEQTSVKVSNQINAILERESGSMMPLREVSQARESRKTLQGYLVLEKKHLNAAVKKREALRQSLRMRREAMATGREAQKTGENYLKEAAVGLERCRKDLGETKKGIEAQRRRIVEDLQTVYPVEPVLFPSPPLLPPPATNKEDNYRCRTTPYPSLSVPSHYQTRTTRMRIRTPSPQHSATSRTSHTSSPSTWALTYATRCSRCAAARSYATPSRSSPAHAHSHCG